MTNHHSPCSPDLLVSHQDIVDSGTLAKSEPPTVGSDGRILLEFKWADEYLTAWTCQPAEQSEATVVAAGHLAGMDFQADYPAWVKGLFYDLSIRPADISVKPGDRDWGFCGRLFLIGLLKRLNRGGPYPARLQHLLLSELIGTQQGSQASQQKAQLRDFIRGEMARSPSMAAERTYLAVYSASHASPLYRTAAKAAADAHGYEAMLPINQPLRETVLLPPDGLEAQARERSMQRADLIAIIAGKACNDLAVPMSELDCLPPWAKT
jgi:hypothetical protein